MGSAVGGRKGGRDREREGEVEGENEHIPSGLGQVNTRRQNSVKSPIRGVRNFST